MGCYNSHEWMNYCRELNDKNTMDEMEEHLRSCDKCLETYMSAVEASSIEDEAAIVPAGFVQEVMGQIGIRKVKEKNAPSRKGMADTAIYYAVAACLTLVLSLGGAFRFVSDNLPAASGTIARSSAAFGDMVGIEWPRQLEDKTRIMLRQISISNLKE